MIARLRSAAIGTYGCLLLGMSAASAQTPDLVSHDLLRVCGEPHNLPFSNQQREGFENKIADLIGQELHIPVTYIWYPQVGNGFVRKTLRSNQCDLVMGTASGDTSMDTTNPYYHTGYMIVTRKDSGIDTDTIDGKILAGKKIGVVASTPPADLMVKADLMDNVKTYSLMVDTRQESPAREMLQDIVDHKIDAGLLWAPFAGYYIKHDDLPLKAVFIKGDEGRLDFHIAMGVRQNDAEWRRAIDKAIAHRKADIDKILADYNIPLLDEQNHPIGSAAAGQ